MSFWVWILIGSIIIGAASVVGFFAFLETFFVSGVLGFVAYVCFIAAKESLKQLKEKKQVEQLEKEEENKKKQLDIDIEEGRWIFPTKEYYEECQGKHIVGIADDDYSYVKAKQIAESILDKYNVDPKHWGKFTSKNKLNDFLIKGKKSVEKEEEEKILQQKIIRYVGGTQEEKTFITRASALNSTYGNQKRVKMLRFLEYDCQERRLKLQEGKKAMEELSQHIYNSQQKEESWGFIGGLAEGMAGPAAGIAAAMDTMARNEKIRENNLAVKEMSLDMLKCVPEVSRDIKSLEEEEKNINKLAEEAEEKIVLTKYTSKEIFDNIKIGRTVIKKTKTGVLDINVNVSIKNKFNLSVPKNVMMVVDGVLTGNIFYNGNFVGKAYIPLPLYGIESNMTSVITLEGMVARSAKYPGEYTIEFDEDEQNLWIMEA